MVIFLNSLFGQFCKDTFLGIPLGVMSWFVIVGFFVFMSPNQSLYLPMSRGWHCHNLGQKGLISFIFGDSSISFTPWVLFLYSLNTMLVMMNVVGLLPYSLTFTSHISFTYSLAFPLWGAMQLIGLFHYFNFRVSHFLPSGTPWALVPLMVLMEIVGVFIQPVALGLRLAANMTAGHLLIFLFSVAIWTISSMSLITSFVFLMVLFLLFFLEMGVAMIQAYVFVALLHFYFTQNVEE